MIYYYFINKDWTTVMTTFGILIALGFEGDTTKQPNWGEPCQ